MNEKYQKYEEKTDSLLTRLVNSQYTLFIVAVIVIVTVILYVAK